MSLKIALCMYMCMYVYINLCVCVCVCLCAFSESFSGGRPVLECGWHLSWAAVLGCVQKRKGVAFITGFFMTGYDQFPQVCSS